MVESAHGTGGCVRGLSFTHLPEEGWTHRVNPESCSQFVPLCTAVDSKPV